MANGSGKIETTLDVISLENDSNWKPDVVGSAGNNSVETLERNVDRSFEDF